MSLERRLDDLKELIQTPEFLEGKGLSNEVNIRIFCYDAKDEIVVDDFIQKIVKNRSLACYIKECNLYRIFLSICEDVRILDKIPSMELRDGSNSLIKRLTTAINARYFVNKINYEPHCKGDILLISGVGDVFPFIRVHSLLEALQPHFSDIPILVMYPGEFNGYQLKLFNKLEPDNYYRAFNAICMKEDK